MLIKECHLEKSCYFKDRANQGRVNQGLTVNKDWIYGLKLLFILFSITLFQDSSEVPIRMYYCVENSREYQEVGPQFMDVDSDTAPAIEALIQKYPEYIKVEDLPMDELDGKMKVVQDLWERKLLLTKLPLEAHYDD